MRAALFLNVATMESRRQMSYRTDFWINVVMNFVVAIGVPYYLWGAVFSVAETDSLGGFSFEGMVIYICLVVLISRIVRGGDQTIDVSTDIYEGSLSRFLVYPTGYLTFKYAQHLGKLLPHVVQLFVFCPILALIVDLPADIAITRLSVLLAASSIAVGNLLYYLLAYPLQLVAFWADNVWSLGVMLRMGSNLLGGAMIPLALFPDAARTVVDFLPFAALYHLPVGTLLGKLSVEEWARGMGLALIWVVVLYGVGRMLWRRGELTYTGVGI